MRAQSFSVDRSTLAESLTAAMSNGSEDLLMPFASRRGPVKSYALEVNGVEESHDRLERIARTLDLSVAGTEDPSLTLLWADGVRLTVDTLDPRFWLLHTASSAGEVRPLLQRIVWTSREIDWCWFPSAQLRELQMRGTSRWFKSDFKGDDLLPPDGQTARRLKVQLEGEHPEVLLDNLLADPRYRPSTALTSIGVRLTEPQLGSVDEAAHYQGRFIARGDSFEVHLGFVSQAVGRYAKSVRTLESEYQIKWSGTPEEGATFTGRVLTMRFGRRVANLEHFVAGLFSCKDPFRLWAVPRFVGQDFVEAEAVDLHIGEQIRLDITSEWLRLYLPSRACGNTIARLYANLQHRYDATVDPGTQDVAA